jgi:uncharacterized repeat protein (TIGR02543 family)
VSIYVDPYGSGTIGWQTGYEPTCGIKGFHPGEPVVVKLVSTEPGYIFDSWTVSGASGDTSVPGEVSFYMPSNEVTVTANFSAIPTQTPEPTSTPTPTTPACYDVSIYVDPYGAGAIGWQTGYEPTCGEKGFHVGEPVVVKLVSTEAGYVFDSWTVSGASGNTSVPGEVSFYMPAGPVTVTANFAVIPTQTPTPPPTPTPTKPACYDVSIYVNPYGDGTLAWGGSGPTCGANGFHPGEEVIVYVSSTTPGYQFDSWTVSGASGNTSVPGQVSFSMPSNGVTVTANFSTITTPDPCEGCPTAGTLISTYCDGTTKMGTYSDGCCGTYDSAIEYNSADCGYTTTTTTTTTTTLPPALCYFYKNDTMSNFGGSVNLCLGGVGYDDIPMGATSNYCLSSPPAEGFTENGSCT